MFRAYELAYASAVPTARWGNRPDSTESSGEVIEVARALVALAVSLNIIIALSSIYNESDESFMLVMVLSVLFCSAFEMVISLAFFSVQLITLPCRKYWSAICGGLASHFPIQLRICS